jgi:hypothetical protein
MPRGNAAHFYRGASKRHGGSHKYRDCHYVTIMGNRYRQLEPKEIDEFKKSIQRIIDGKQLYGGRKRFDPITGDT